MSLAAERQKVLVVAAHPDDEVLGAGGVMAKHVQKGDEVFSLIIGDGITSRYEENELNKDSVRTQVEAIKGHCLAAGKVLGVKNTTVLGNYCCRFDRRPILDMTKAIEKEITRVKPDIVYTHNCSDVNNDHGIVFKAVLTATRPSPDFCVKKLLTFEVLSSTEWGFHAEFRPNVYEDISSTIHKKIEAMKVYESEVREFPHARSLEAIKILAQKRGAEVGLNYAECFKLIRDVR